MNAGEARALAERWAAEHARRFPAETLGVLTYGSINWMADEDPFPAASDIDLMVVVPAVDPTRHRICKRAYGGIAVEPSYQPRERFASVEALLADWALAPNVAHAQVCFDPERLLHGLQRAMAPELARRHWVRQRCRGLRACALSLIEEFAQSDRLVYLNAVACLAVRAMAQMALLADLRNPTVKKALVKARDVLDAYGMAEGHHELLRLAGYAELDDLTIVGASSHCRQALDEACRWLRTPFIGDNCVSSHSRLALEVDVPACIAAGTGREIFLWIETLYEHAMIAIENDAPPAIAAAMGRLYLDDMAPLRSTTPAEARQRMLACRPALDAMLALCDEIVGRNACALD